jgi:5-methylcytosine-specific restriction endonuclease McrA
MHGIAYDEVNDEIVIPVALGGASTLENLQVLCAPCNQRKGATLG